MDALRAAEGLLEQPAGGRVPAAQHERVAEELGGIDELVRGEWTTRGGHDQHPFLTDEGVDQGRIGLPGHEGEVELTTEQVVAHRRPAPRLDGELPLGMARAELRENRRKDVAGDGRRGPDPYPALVAPPLPLQVSIEHRLVPQHLFRVGIEHLAGRRGLDAVRAAVDQLDAIATFEPVEEHAHPGLSHGELAGGRRDATVVEHRDERAQVEGVHRLLGSRTVAVCRRQRGVAAGSVAG